MPPATISRDERQRATVRAIKVTEPIRQDGKLDEAVYAEHPPFGDFIQVVPKLGFPASERTDVWVLYDERNIYVSAKVWDTAPPSQWVANEMRRDTTQLRNNDHIAVAFDTYYDRRSGFMFYLNPLGGFADYTVVDESGGNLDWNPVWTSRTGRFDGGWTVELAIPFRSLRYTSGDDMVWGFQMRRSIRRKNEWAYLSPVPQNLAGPQALNRVSTFGTLGGLDLPPASRNMEVKPYALSRVTTDRVNTPRVDNDLSAAVGGDFKYGVTANLTADVTVNTDFAQVEVDEQQVNLTRFSLFLPEKRDFFLEGRGNFDFARGGAGQTASDTPILFYSRRIGLNRGRVIPLDTGARLTGKAAGWGLGAANIQAGDEHSSGTAATNFSVVRIKRDVLRRSTIGAIYTNRTDGATVARPGRNQAVGVDAAFAFFENVAGGAYYARTDTEGLDGDSESYQGKLEWAPDRYGARIEHTKVGGAFNPEMGFLRRTNFNKTSGYLRFSPRPKSLAAVRKFTTEATYDYYLNGNGSVETKTQELRFNTEFESSDQFTIEGSNNYEALFVPFAVGEGVSIPVGGYSFANATMSYTLGQQRRFTGTVAVQAGQFYNGTIKAVTVSSARYAVLKQLSVEPSVSINRIDLPYGSFTTRLFRVRSDYAFSPRMFMSALVQRGTADDAFSSNVRFRWEFIPGSEFFAVWTDEHDTRPDFRGLKNRAFVIKLTRLLRF